MRTSPYQESKYLGAIILINYNTASYSLQAVNSIIEHTSGFMNFQLVVVDNASEYQDFKILDQGIKELRRTNITVTRSRINTGFGGGNMFGIQFANADYYVFVNNDVLLKEDSFNKMIAFLKKTPEAAMAGAQSEDENGKTYKAFDYHLSLRKELLSDNLNHFLSPGEFPNRRKPFAEPARVGAIPGSLMVCKAADFDAVGGFDPNLFLYYEEKDICFRLKQKGRATFSLPETTFIHLKGKSTPPTYAVQQELKISQFYTLRKNLGPFRFSIFFCFNAVKYFFKAPFSTKNRKIFLWILRGASLAESLKHKQRIHPAPARSGPGPQILS